MYTIKEGVDGLKTYKARYVAKGYSQVKDIDYAETFAPTASLTSIRILMQLAAQYDLILHQMDVKTAYLNAPIDYPIYMEQPEGFEISSKKGKLVYKLNRSLYGLKQSGRNWNMILNSFLLENDFVRNCVDPCVYTKHVKDQMIVILVWVDDLIIATSNNSLLCEVKELMKNKYHMKDLGKLSYFLGIEFDQGKDYIKMSQQKYVYKVLEKFEMTNCKPRSTPSEQKPDFDSGDSFDSRKYREAVGSLIYAMTCTRPDICWVVTKLSQYLSDPNTKHWIAVKHVLRYLKGTIDFGLSYKKDEDGLALVGYSDADWASSIDDRRSTTGYCFSLTKTGPLVSWKSKKQPTVALSSCEAEYMALAATTQESLYLKQLLSEMDIGHKYECAVIFEDNQGTIALSKNSMTQQRSKHIDVRYHFIRSELNDGRIVIQYCPTNDMKADIMTKSATKFKLDRFKTYIFGK